MRPNEQRTFAGDPELRRMFDICTLTALVAAREKQHDFGYSDGVVEAIAGFDIDSQLADTVTQELVVANVA